MIPHTSIDTANYYNSWDKNEEIKLFELLKNTEAKFILSTWHHNKYRKNKYIDLLWNNFNINILEHFYHIGASEENRNSMQEAIVTNFAENEEDYMQFSFPSKGYQQ